MTTPAPISVPGDYAPLDACWTAWPHHEYAWGRHLAAAQHEFSALCAALTAREGSEPIELLCDDDAAERDARDALAACGDRVRYRRLRYGDVWLRDTAPIFARGGGDLRCVHFAWNGWGRKYLYPNDAELAGRIADALGLPCTSLEPRLEGGALEFDGEGTCLTTDCCTLNENRNPGLDRAAFEALLADALGVERVLWFARGLAGDHTDGHIDNLVRFAAPGVVVRMEASEPADPNGEVFDEVARALERMVDARGRTLEAVVLPSPGLVTGDEGTAAASYLNFYVGNRTVVMPAFGKAQDERARRALEQAFPDREVVSSPARALLEGGGTFHCMTRGQPRA